jgi:hypothetical protein
VEIFHGRYTDTVVHSTQFLFQSIETDSDAMTTYRDLTFHYSLLGITPPRDSVAANKTAVPW